MKSKLGICESCEHFFQTSMTISMSNRNFGYCLLIQSKKTINQRGIRDAKIEAIMKKTDTCEGFEKLIRN
ncbi:hypothetical protein [Tenacibaculum haliotis]|uniref:hypothetical protein n=1 Tax=Tenacibaculum haliotis TaxID=1888914 RepID=UPI0021AE497C|nr:hypothetical protein [Tenacibaculum haliotis]MCT4697620.1 hypothetical protein [Tenacibaculum haliotis]